MQNVGEYIKGLQKGNKAAPEDDEEEYYDDEEDENQTDV
jgi:hypothetical protein